MLPLSEQILQENQPIFEAMINHRFVTEIKTNNLSEEHFFRYLVFEGLFVENAIAIFAFACAKARTIAQRRQLIRIQDALANGQISYFEQTFAVLKLDPNQIDASIHAVAAFRDGMLAIARDGDYDDIITAMFAAEWMYWTWSKTISLSIIDNPFIRQWVALHVDDDFSKQALWLKAELDEAGQNMDAARRSELSALFGKVQQLEIAFHDGVYSEHT